MGHFYNPPPPSQGNSASTPPLPHDPIPAQGASPPPIRQAALAVTMLTILASWPADLEPRLQRPNDQQQKIAPLTLRYGQEQRNPPLSAQEIAKLVSLWPTDVGPVLPAPYGVQNVSAATIPVPVSFVPYVRPSYALFVPSETYDVSLVQRRALQTPDNPSQPPTQFPLSRAQQTIISTWSTDLEPRLQRPNDSQQKLVLPPVIATVAYTPPPYAIIAANQSPTITVPTPVAIAPLTLPTGATPIPQGPVTVSELTQLVGSWAQTWDAQTAPKNASWNVPPILSAVPYSTLPRAIWTAWEPPFVAPPAPVTIAPLTLPTGAAPAPRGPLSVTTLTQTVATWATTWDAQHATPTAGWNVPPILVSLPYTPLPRHIWTVWEPPWIQPPAPVTIAVLTLPTGNQPPVRALDRQVTTVATWVVDSPLPMRPLVAGWNVPVTSYVPPPAFSLVIRTSWDEPLIRIPRLVTIATAAIPPPQAPPIRSGWTRSHAIAQAAWPAALEPGKTIQAITAWVTPSGLATITFHVVHVANESLGYPQVTQEALASPNVTGETFTHPDILTESLASA